MKRLLQAVLLVLPAAFSISCHADTLPRWEAGAGVALLEAPDYRGSNLHSTSVVPLPYVIYRGRIIRADREGLRASLFESEKTDLVLSLNLNLATNRDDNPLRQGMPNLRPTVELGPALGLRLWQSADRHAQVEFRLPLRAGLTLETPPHHIGWVLSPNLNLKLRDPGGFGGWKLGLQAGPVFQSSHYNDYFYGISAAQATANRPAFAASSGYAGSQATLTLSKRFPRWWAGAYMRYDDLRGASFSDSPLLQQRHALVAGFGVAWVLGTSSVSVEAEE